MELRDFRTWINKTRLDYTRQFDQKKKDAMDLEKELLECLKDYIKQTEIAHVQKGIWFNKVYKDAKELLKKATNNENI